MGHRRFQPGCNALDGAVVLTDRRVQEIIAVQAAQVAHQIGKNPLALLTRFAGAHDEVGLREVVVAFQNSQEGARFSAEALAGRLVEHRSQRFSLAGAERRIGLHRQHADPQRIEYLGGVEQVAPDQGGVAIRQEVPPREVSAHGHRLLERSDGARHDLARRQQPWRPARRRVLPARAPGRQEAFRLPTVAGDPRGSQCPHHLASLRDQDRVAGDRLKVVGHGAIRGDPALENDRSVVVEKQVAHARDDRPGLGAAGRCNHVAERIAVLELVDRGGTQHGADRRELEGRIVIHALGQLLDGHVQSCRDAVQECAGAGSTDAAHLRDPDLHVLIEQHRLAVLSADVENGPAIGIEVGCRGNVCRHLADRGIEMHKAKKLVNHLAAGRDGTCHVVPGDSGLGEESVHRLGDGTKVAPAAHRASARTLRSCGRLRLSALV